MSERQRLEQAILDGGSVIRHGQIITNIDDLPSAKELAEESGQAKEASAVEKADAAAKKAAEKDVKDGVKD